ncbi:MAG: TlyA family RNA methyltransferase [Acidobacteria bacterium]|nr:TlyA family RNA methyltransferase [Acidobacteriota bacterium]
MKHRLDQLVTLRGLADSREKARALILAGSVLADGQKATKPGHSYPDTTRIELLARPPYVSRGGIKLAAAIAHFHIPVQDRVCADIGASTGGFTDCLLQHGAARVYAIDTGAGQIDWKLRTDLRVVLLENTNARYLAPASIPEPLDLIVCDVSFISVTLILPALFPLLKPDGEMVILVKPQFEAGRHAVGKGGIVRDPAHQSAACEKVRAAVESRGCRTAMIESPIPGAEGNREFLLYASHSDGGHHLPPGH